MQSSDQVCHLHVCEAERLQLRSNFHRVECCDVTRSHQLHHTCTALFLAQGLSRVAFGWRLMYHLWPNTLNCIGRISEAVQTKRCQLGHIQTVNIGHLARG